MIWARYKPDIRGPSFGRAELSATYCIGVDTMWWYVIRHGRKPFLDPMCVVQRRRLYFSCMALREGGIGWSAGRVGYARITRFVTATVLKTVSKRCIQESRMMFFTTL